MMIPAVLQFVRVTVLKGTWKDDPTPRWFVIGHINDGSEIILEDTLSEREAIMAAADSAKDFAVPLMAAA